MAPGTGKHTGKGIQKTILWRIIRPESEHPPGLQKRFELFQTGYRVKSSVAGMEPLIRCMIYIQQDCIKSVSGNGWIKP